jgi:hypothetical protein
MMAEIKVRFCGENCLAVQPMLWKRIAMGNPAHRLRERRNIPGRHK